MNHAILVKKDGSIKCRTDIPKDARVWKEAIYPKFSVESYIPSNVDLDFMSPQRRIEYEICGTELSICPECGLTRNGIRVFEERS